MSPTPSKGLACLQSKLSIPSFLNYRKTLNSGAAPEIPPRPSALQTIAVPPELLLLR